MSQPVHIEPSRRLLFVDTLIPDGQNLSGPVDLRQYALKGLILPPTWTLADVTFQAARMADGDYFDVYQDTGTAPPVAVQVPVSDSSRYIVLGIYAGGVAGRGAAESVVGMNYIKLRSGTPATPVNQVGTKTVTLVLGASTK